MADKLHSHKVTIGDRRRQNKKVSDVRRKGDPKKALRTVFDNYYRDQVRALYRAVSGD